MNFQFDPWFNHCFTPSVVTLDFNKHPSNIISFHFQQTVALNPYQVKPVQPSADSRLIWQGAVPCGPFRHLICTLRPFTKLYMHPLALSVHFSASVCVSVSKSPKRLLDASTKSTKNSEKIHRRLCDHFRRIQFKITGGIN